MSAWDLYYGGGSQIPAKELANWLTKNQHPDSPFVENSGAGYNKIVSAAKDKAWCRLFPIPSQCGMCLAAYWGWLDESYLEEVVQRVVRIAKALRYSAIMVTMPIGNRQFATIMEKNGFSILTTFDNMRSNNTNNIFLKCFDPDAPE